MAPKTEASLTAELLLLILKLHLCKGKRSDSIPSIIVISTVGLLFAMNNRKGCQDIRSIGVNFMDIIFPSNALKCKYLMAVMYFVTVMSSICFSFILYYIKDTIKQRAGDPLEGLAIFAL